nr:MAG TPA: hypothetical protein [Bacteriophage sp.]
MRLITPQRKMTYLTMYVLYDHMVTKSSGNLIFIKIFS